MRTVDDLSAFSPPAEGIPPKFPAAPYVSAATYFGAYAEETARAASSVEAATFARAAEMLLEAYTGETVVFSCGNGGSASIANHLQCDHTKNVRKSTDLAPRVMSLRGNVELLTAIANDLAYEDVFFISFSPNRDPATCSSPSRHQVVRPISCVRSIWAREHGLRTIALTGFDGGDARNVAEVAIHVNSTNYGVVEDMHQTIMHALAQYIRQSRMTPAAISSNVF